MPISDNCKNCYTPVSTNLDICPSCKVEWPTQVTDEQLASIKLFEIRTAIKNRIPQCVDYNKSKQLVCQLCLDLVTPETQDSHFLQHHSLGDLKEYLKDFYRTHQDN